MTGVKSGIHACYQLRWRIKRRIGKTHQTRQMLVQAGHGLHGLGTVSVIADAVGITEMAQHRLLWHGAGIMALPIGGVGQHQRRHRGP